MSRVPAVSGFSRPPIAILGVPLENVTAAETMDLIEQMIASRRPHYIVTANVDFLTQAAADVELRRILFDSDLALCDGTPVLWASRFLGNPLPERVAGSDLVPLVIEAASKKGYRLFFLGSTPETGQTAMAKLRERFPGLKATHYSPPFRHLLEMDHDEITRRIREANPDVLFVCFGCPKQEKWMAMHHRSLGVPVSMGVGGTLDFLAGHLKRAPKWMQRTGTEWVFRLAQEPRRLLKRYVKDFWVFGVGIAAQWWRLRLRQARRSAGASTPLGHPTPGVPTPASHSAMVTDAGVAVNFSQPAMTANESGASSERFLRVSLPARFDCAATRADPAFVARILADGRHCFVDMSSVQLLDSTGIGVLIRLRKSLRAARRHLILISPSRRVSRALAMMRLETFFDSAPDESGAMRILEDRDAELRAVVDPAAPAAIAWRGEVTASNAPEVWERTKAALSAASSGALVIDLSRLRFIDSTGLGLMVRARKFAEQQGGRVAFSTPGRTVRNVIRVAGLETMLFAPSRGGEPGPVAVLDGSPSACVT